MVIEMIGEFGQAGPGPCREAVLLRARMRAQGHVDVRLSGRCMEPLLVAGDWARVVPVADVSVGDICLVALPDAVALHRLVWRDGAELVTKGDFSGRAERVTASDIVGVATAFRLVGSSHWADYDETREGKLRIAELSLSLCAAKGSSGSSASSDTKLPAALCADLVFAPRSAVPFSCASHEAERREVWRLNQIARAALAG